MKYLVFIFVLLCVSSASTVLAAPVVFDLATETGNAAALVTCSGPDCTLCSLMQMFDKIIDWLVGISMVLATIALAWSGFKMVYSQGPGELSKMKKILSSVIVGIILIMTAWMLVDTLMKLLVGGESEFGAWNSIAGDCGGMNAAPVLTDEDRQIGLTSHPNSLELETADVTGNTYGPASTFGPRPIVNADTTADGQFSYNSGISSQRGHASVPLSNMLNCMANKLPGGVGTISSISDSVIVSLMAQGNTQAEAFAKCTSGEVDCAHDQDPPVSRHYGGNTCTGSSYAVDFGDESNIEVICRAANSCGVVSNCEVHNGNHVHLDLPLSCN